jgi:hypothetical protein
VAAIDRFQAALRTCIRIEPQQHSEIIAGIHEELGEDWG